MDRTWTSHGVEGHKLEDLHWYRHKHTGEDDADDQGWLNGHDDERSQHGDADGLEQVDTTLVGAIYCGAQQRCWTGGLTRKQHRQRMQERREFATHKDGRCCRSRE